MAKPLNSFSSGEHRNARAHLKASGYRSSQQGIKNGISRWDSSLFRVSFTQIISLHAFCWGLIRKLVCDNSGLQHIGNILFFSISCLSQRLRCPIKLNKPRCQWGAILLASVLIYIAWTCAAILLSVTNLSCWHSCSRDNSLNWMMLIEVDDQWAQGNAIMGSNAAWIWIAVFLGRFHTNEAMS